EPATMPGRPRWARMRSTRPTHSTCAASTRACVPPGSPTRKETSLSSTRATRTRRTRRRSVADLLPTFERGRPQPLGATVDDGGVNFSVFSEDATAVELLLFDAHNDAEPVATIPFDPVQNRSFHFWHMYVRGLGRGYHYAFRVHGPTDDPGKRFDPEKVLLDPYAKGNTNTLWKPVDACLPG